jgi:transposase
MMKRQGVIYDLTVSYWTKKHYSWLKSVTLPAWTREVLNLKLLQLDQLEAQLMEVDRNLNTIFDTTPQYKTHFDIYTRIPGIGRVGAMTLVLEGGDLKRFPRATSLMSYVGLFPGKLSSSTKDPALRITKAGNSYLRYAIVNAAKYYRDRRLLLSQKQIASLPKKHQSFFTRMQDRLSSRYRHLTTNGKKAKVAHVAVARELCGFIWELICKIENDIQAV